MRVSLVAVPEVMTSTLNGAYDVFCMAGQTPGDALDGRNGPLFQAEIVGREAAAFTAFGGMPVRPHRAIAEVTHTDVVFLPSVYLRSGEGLGEVPAEVVAWIGTMYERGAAVCAACTGSLLLARTGLLDGREATTHWMAAEAFRRQHPRVRLCPDRVLVRTGPGDRLVTAGGGAAWHDLVLYLIARFCGERPALNVAKMFLLQWHADGQMAYANFQQGLQHADAAVRRAQEWLGRHYQQGQAVDGAVGASGLRARTFSRRFKQATGLSPLAYVQLLRIERAKQLLERPEVPVERVGSQIGYDDPTFFRRLFRRGTGLTPAQYRRRFATPVRRD